MKINLGSGHKRYQDFVNVDDPNTQPDFLMDLEKGHLPFDSDSVSEIRAHHILEHIGPGFMCLMQEIYRVCEHDALIDITVPHHTHEVFYGDSTHKRPITVNTMMLFSKKICEKNRQQGDSSSDLATRYGVDFDVVWYDFDYDDFYLPLVNTMKQQRDRGTLSPQDDFAFQRLMREGNNVAIQTKINMRAIKR